MIPLRPERLVEFKMEPNKFMIEVFLCPQGAFYQSSLSVRLVSFFNKTLDSLGFH